MDGRLAAALTRHELALLLRVRVFEAEHFDAVRDSELCPAHLLSWCEGLIGLADSLERTEAVNPCALARARTLLMDRSGPLYRAETERSLGEAFWRIADGMHICPPHAWACPVIMKLDPEHVAWTCKYCGDVATSDDLALTPGA